MGNCYGEDGDSEDEYYGYYGKNNRLKPKTSPTPPNPNLTLSEPDPHKFDHDDLNPPTLSEPDYYNTEYANIDRENDANDADWEDDGENETESVGAYEHGAPKYENNGEWESEAETEEYEDGVLTRGEYEHSVLEYENTEKEHGVYEPHQPERDNDETYELEGLAPASGEWGYEPQALNHNNGALGTHGDTYGCDGSNNVCGFTPSVDNIKPHTPSNTTPHTPHPAPTTPNPSIARSHPPPWPDTTYNTHSQSRPPPWPD